MTMPSSIKWRNITEIIDNGTTREPRLLSIEIRPLGTSFDCASLSGEAPPSERSRNGRIRSVERNSSTLARASYRIFFRACIC